jgi:hypothetical protein
MHAYAQWWALVLVMLNLQFIFISCLQRPVFVMEYSSNVTVLLVLLCFSVICDLLAKIRNDIGCLFKLCEVIAELDMLTSFANLSSVSTYVRPQFGSFLDIRQSRHPILDFVLQHEPVPNDVVCALYYYKQENIRWYISV